MQARELLEQMAERRLDEVGLEGLDRQLMLSLAARHIEMARTGRPDEAPSHLVIDTARYLDPDLFAREKRAIFDRFPVIAGLSRDLPNPGDFIKLDELDTPIFVTRTQTGEAKAYVNSCRHRGAALVYDRRGNSRGGFSCPYHAWSYGLDGRLVGLPCPQGFEGMDRSQFALVEVPCEELHGIIFVATRPGAALDIKAHLGPELTQELGFWDFDKIVAARSEPIELEGNWKLVLETFLEAYHFSYAHKDNLAHYYNGNISTVDRMGRHLRTSSSLRTIQHELPSKPQSEWVPENYVQVKYTFFPGMVLINSPQVLEMFCIFPQSVDHTILQHSCYSRLPMDEEKNVALFEQIWNSAHGIVQTQDFPYGVTTAHRGMKSGAITNRVIGRNEWPIQIMHETVAAAIAEYETGAA